MRTLLFFLALALSTSLLAQLQTQKIILLNSGKYEFAAPYSDRVTIGAYRYDTKTYHNFDTIQSESAQHLIVQGDYAYAAAENNLVKYDLKSEKRVAAATYQGVSPHKMAIKGNYLLVGNWYGQSDSGLYIYDANNLQLLNVTAGITKDVKAIAIKGDTAFIAQNISGTIDYCAPYGCYNDTIGTIAQVKISTNSLLRIDTLGTDAAGISALFMDGNDLISINTESASITNYNTTNNTWVTSLINLGSISAPFYMDANTDEVFFYLNNSSYKYNYTTHTLNPTITTPLQSPTATAYDYLHNDYYQTTTDYTTFGKLYHSINGTVVDTSILPVSPENIAIYYSTNSAPIAYNDTATTTYLKDTFIQVLANDYDITDTPLILTQLSAPTVLGAIAAIVNNQVYYVPAIGVRITDSLNYTVCDQSGACAQATLYIIVEGVTNTGIDEENKAEARMFPNPFQDRIFIQTSLSNMNIKLLNMSGQLLIENDVKTGNSEMDTKDLPSGIYLLEVKTGNSSIIQKMVK